MTISNYEEAKSYGVTWQKMQQVKSARIQLIRTYMMKQAAQAKQGVADAIEITEILQELNDVFKYLISKLGQIKSK